MALMSRIVLVWALFISNAAIAQAQIDWMTDLNMARAKASQENRLLLLHFWSKSCPPCLKLETNVFPRPDVVTALEANYVAVKINVDTNGSLAKQLNVTRWPTDVIVTTEGKILSHSVSPQAPTQYIGMVNQVAYQARPYLQAQAQKLYAQQVRVAQSRQNHTQTQAAHQQNFAQNSALQNTFVKDNRAQRGSHQYQTNVQTLERYPLNSQLARHQMEQGQNQFTQNNGQQQNNLRQDEYRQNSYQNQLQQHQGQLGQYDHHYQLSQNNSQNNQFTQNQRQRTQKQTVAQNNWQKNHQAQNLNYQNSYQDQQVTQQEANKTITSEETYGFYGFCPVTMLKESRWQKGDSRFGAKHRGMVYLFASREAQQTFLTDPDNYSPYLQGYDLVLFAETGKLSLGKCDTALFSEDGTTFYMFSSEASLERFEANPHRYLSLLSEFLQKK